MPPEAAQSPAPAPTQIAAAAVRFGDEAGDSELLQCVVDEGAQLFAHGQTALMLVAKRQTLVTMADSGGLARACSHVEGALRDGPSAGAVRERQPVLVDARTDERWPRLTDRVRPLNVTAVMAVPLPDRGRPLGALTWYSTAPAGFGPREVAIAEALAIHAALALRNLRSEANLRAGMTTREEIGQAVGILMERRKIKADDAFGVLIHVSQSTNRKLRDIARWMISTGEEPDTLSPL
jgi:GAF domain-containing protein